MNSSLELGGRIKSDPNNPMTLSLTFQALTGSGLRDTKKNADLVRRALCGSLDAARAVHILMIPGWDWKIEMIYDVYTVYVYRPIAYEGKSSNPGAAWLAAICMAKHTDKPKPTHEHSRQGDEYYCHKCNKRWGFEEQPPECV